MARRKIEVIMTGDSRSLERAFGSGTKAAKQFGVSLGSLVKIGAIVGSLEALGRAGASAFREFADAQKANAQTVAVLRSTGAAANVTAKQVDKLATAISQYSGIDDEVVKGGQNVLLTFTQIRNVVGKGRDVFNQATAAVADLSVAMGLDMKAAALQVGKALNDPERGFARLQRIGVAFTKTQIAQIKGFTRLGDTASAQRVILAELTKEFGGSARALGQTLPGQIARLRESLKNLGGDLIGVVAKPLGTAFEALSRFVERFSAAEGVQARFKVAFDGVKSLGRDLFDQVRRAIAGVDWNAVFQRARVEIPKAASRVLELLADGLRFVGRTISRVLGAIDWRALGRFLGNRIVAAFDAVRSLLQSVDWNRVGGALIRGFTRFLAAVPWKRIVTGAFRLAVAAIKGVASLLLGAGEEIGKALLKGARAGLATAGNFLRRKALEIVLKIVEPFTHLPAFLGGWARDAKERVTKQLNLLAGNSEKAADRVVAAADRIRQAKVIPDVNLSMLSGSQLDDAIRKQGSKKSTGPSRTTTPTTTPPLPTIAGGGRTAAERAQRIAQFFDNKISRALDRVQDIQSLKGQLGRLQQIAAVVTKRIQITKDVTRKLALEDTLLGITRQIKSTRQQLTTDFLDALQFGVDKAQVTRQLSDDLGALQTLQRGLQQRVKAEGATLELQRQLLTVRGQITDTQQQIRQRQIAARQADQFKALGLDAAGGDRVPGLAALRKQLQKLDGAVTGTFLDTSKTKSLMQRIRKVLAGGLGAVGQDVRSKIKEILDGIDNDLRNRSTGSLTRFQKANTDKILGGLGLSREQAGQLRSRLSVVGAGGTVASIGRVGAFGVPIAAGATTIILDQPINLDGATVARVVTKHQVKAGARTTGQRGQAARRNG